MQEALQRLTPVLSENFESQELGIIGPKKCGHVKLMNRTIEYRPGGFQWRTEVQHARAVVELMGLDVKTSKPAPTPWIKCCPGGPLRNAEDDLEDEDRGVYSGHVSLSRIGQTRHPVFCGSLHVGAVVP